MRARIAEASSTTLFEFTFRSLAPFGDQLIRQRNAWLDILPCTPLSALESPLHCSDPNFILFPTENDFITRVNAKRSAELQWDHDASILVHLESYFCRKSQCLCRRHDTNIA